jgi:acetyl-CoA synthase
MYEHVVSGVGFDNMVERALEVRGLKVVTTKIDIPVAYGPAFAGERIKKDNLYIEANEPRLRIPAFEFVTTKDVKEIEDGKVEVIGPDLDDVEEGSGIPLGIWVEVAGARMQEDFEPILERHIHETLNDAQGVLHIGQRDIIWIRISKAAYKSGFRLEHIGRIIIAKFHADYSSILDKVQVKIYTEKEKVDELRNIAKQTYRQRDERVKGLTDEGVDVFYSCTLCQSFAPNHLCIVTPERSGLCGAYNWLDTKAAHQISPDGPNQPIEKGNCIDPVIGQWDNVNAFIKKASHGKIDKMSAYSMMIDPMTSCGCFECITTLLPKTNGVMIVDRDYVEMTPCGMKFSTLAGSVGGGLQTPGFIGHSRYYIGSKKYISAEGGFKRIVWMPKKLKETVKDLLEENARGEGITNFVDLIADETIATTEDEVLEYLKKVNHPVLDMEPMV